MSCCFGYHVIYKPATHILGALGLWVFLLILLFVENGVDLSKRLDQLHTYQLQKYPLNYDNAKETIRATFAANWDDACMAATSFGSVPAGCSTKRAALVTGARAALGCDVYRSASCSCMNQILRGINNDSNHASTTALNTIGTLGTAGKSLGGYRESILYALDSCHYLHHHTQLAAETGPTWVRRTGLAFLLSTLITGNLIAAFVVQTTRWGRILTTLVFPTLGVLVVYFMENSALNLLLYIIVPPALLFVWSEFLLPSLKRGPFISPYFFGAILATLNAIALSENDVLDYDVITTEVMKGHLVSYLYFGAAWFVASAEDDPAASKASYMKKPAQDSLYIASLLAAGVTVGSALAPYTAVAYLNMLWWLPTLFVVGGFFGVLWVGEMDRFSDYSHTDVEDRRGKYQTTLANDPGHIRNGTLYLSSLLLASLTLVVIWYWRDYSLTYHTLFELVPTRTIQSNSSYAWLNPALF
jgi:cytochrome c oxidase subunit IV